MAEQIKILFGELDENNITDVLLRWKEVAGIKKCIEEYDSLLRNKIKAYLKERHWERYVDASTKISVTITTQKHEEVSMKQLKFLLSDDQLAQVIRMTSQECLNITTPEAKVRLKKYVQKKKYKRKITR